MSGSFLSDELRTMSVGLLVEQKSTQVVMSPHAGALWPRHLPLLLPTITVTNRRIVNCIVGIDSRPILEVDDARPRTSPSGPQWGSGGRTPTVA